MLVKVTNPDPRIVKEPSGRKVDVTGPIDLKLNNGKVAVVLGVGESQEVDLSGDQVGLLEAHGLRCDYPEKNAPPMPGSKKWRMAVAEKGLDPEAELQKLTAKDKKPASRATGTAAQG